MTNSSPWRRSVLVALLVALIIVIQVLVFFVYQSDRTLTRKVQPSQSNKKLSRNTLSDFDMETNSNTQNRSEELKILWYNIPFYLRPHVNLFKFKPCTCKCSISVQDSDLAKSDVVIFTQSYMPHDPPPKEKHHVWCFNTMENLAFAIKPGPLWMDKFEWIMSYRRNSDISRPYGIIRKREKPVQRDYSQVFKQKTKLGVWMSGHCPVPSKRKPYIQELKNFMEVDMHGSCGMGTCIKRTPFVTQCVRNFSRDYKFYFAFENNICHDYTTEKFYNFFSTENLNIVPVVNGPSMASDYLPKGTFINALDFPSHKDLAKKLKEIGSNETAYTQFLKEKDKYYALTEPEVFREAMCDICEKIHRGGRKIPNRENFWEFHYKDTC
ncbi:alpha-(1,3)-fucosyltransferase fut-5-like [Ostrea edulis]|uniref:alpha-(1,3)-fucosyltransferase fut-5-like n=1 Tax=Ostrea edulis TaxID=37623 RepID=UPI0024AE88BE|nr:alpha-(1,3)-fucosyltransferase fut-5-like [Ostrea edulis]